MTSAEVTKIEWKLFLQNGQKLGNPSGRSSLLSIFCLCRLMQNWKVRQHYTWLLKRRTYTSWNCCLTSDLTWSSRFAVFSDSVCVCMRTLLHPFRGLCYNSMQYRKYMLFKSLWKMSCVNHVYFSLVCTSQQMAQLKKAYVQPAL